MRFEDDIDDAELLELMDAPTVPRSAGDGSRGTASATPAAEAPAVATAAPAVDPALATSLTATLKKFFGHDAFRAGQLDVVAAAVSGRDAAVYWSTGSGKSMCYQIPALHTGRTTLVVSPLVSLMQDQVTHLNNTAGEGRRELAAFLGSAQTDDSVQERALGGEFAVLYVTPEKLVGFVDDDGDVRASHEKKTNEPTYFVRRLKQMVERQTLGLVAVDEAHCVSQWGHDFRAAYRALDALRFYLAPNGEVPLMALTATAVGAVSYSMNYQGCCKRDVLFCYDLELPLDFVPTPDDGEVESFERYEISKVIDIMATTEDFKPNCCLVIIDFCVRHGFITPDEPGYAKLVQSLRVGND